MNVIDGQGEIIWKIGDIKIPRYRAGRTAVLQGVNINSTRQAGQFADGKMLDEKSRARMTRGAEVALHIHSRAIY